MTCGRSILRLSFDLPPDADAELPERLRRLLEDFTPRVQLLEDGALLDLCLFLIRPCQDSARLAGSKNERVMTNAVLGSKLSAAMGGADSPVAVRP
ncbi:hypothetical protein ABT255_32465 [Streptomyces mirabilis]